MEAGRGAALFGKIGGDSPHQGGRCALLVFEYRQIAVSTAIVPLFSVTMRTAFSPDGDTAAMLSTDTAAAITRPPW
jgi:hypothetical protein